ncbi:MAG: nSTAND3 domain-containing NTPase [Thermoplasmataceae archaeon]
MEGTIHSKASPTNLDATEIQIRKHIKTGSERIIVVGQRFTGKTYLANYFSKSSECTGYTILDTPYESEGVFDPEKISAMIEKFRHIKNVIFFIQDYFVRDSPPKNAVTRPAASGVPILSRKTDLREVKVVQHSVNYMEASKIASEGMRELYNVLRADSIERKYLSRIVDSIVEEAKFGRTYIPGIIEFELNFLKNDGEIQKLFGLNFQKNYDSESLILRLRELQSEISIRKEKTDFMLGVFGIEASSGLTAANSIVDSLKTTATAIITPIVSALLGVGIIGLVALSSILMIKSSKNNKGFLVTLSKSSATWKEMPDVKKLLISYRIEMENSLPPMSAYRVIEDLFGDRGKNIRDELRSMNADNLERLKVMVSEGVSRVMGHMDEINEEIALHERKIRDIQNDVKNIEEEVKQIKMSSCFPPTRDDEIKTRSLFYPSQQSQSALNVAKEHKNILITGLSGSGKSATAQYISLKLQDFGIVENVCLNSNITLNYGMASFIRKSAIVIDDAFGETDMTVSHPSEFQKLIELLSKNNVIIMTSRDHVINEVKLMQPALYAFVSSKFNSFYIDTDSFTEQFWKNMFENYLLNYSGKGDNSAITIFRKLEPIVTTEFKLPISYNLFFNGYYNLLLENKISAQEAILKSKNMRNTVALRYISLNKEDRNFLKFVCLFPNLDNRNFINAYNKFYGANLSGEDVDSLRARNNSFLKDTVAYNLVHSECSDGIWDSIAKDEADVKTLLSSIIPMFDSFNTRLQTVSCMIQIIRRYSSLGAEALIGDFLNKYLTDDNAHRRHLATYLLSEIVFAIRSESLVSSSLDLLLGQGDSVFEAIFLLKSISRNRSWENFAVRKFLTIIADGSLFQAVVHSMNMQKFSNGEFLERIENISGKKRAGEIMELYNALNKGVYLTYSTNMSENIIKDLTQWEYIGMNSGKFEKVSQDGEEWIRYHETREDNLGRLYVLLDDYLQSDRLRMGIPYILEAKIRVKNVAVDEKGVNAGAVVGIAYVDDAGWTPRNDAFQVEIGFISGDMEVKTYRSEFRLGAMPPGCTHLILYLVNVVGTGESFFKDIIIRNGDDTLTVGP